MPPEARIAQHVGLLLLFGLGCGLAVTQDGTVAAAGFVLACASMLVPA